MKSSYIPNYCPPPREPDLRDLWPILEDYIVTCDEYPGVYRFMDFLKHLRYCDYSGPTDWFNFKHGIIQSHWCLFVTCRPQDMDRLMYVAKRLQYNIDIINEDSEEDMYLPFV